MSEDESSAAPDDEPVAVESTEPAAGSSRSLAARLSGAVSWLALILAAAALLAAGADYLRNRSTAGASSSLREDLDTVTASMGATQDSLETLEDRVAALTRSGADRGDELARAASRRDDRLDELETLPARISAIEAALASVQGISSGARDAWLVAEAEYYMQIANAQLQLAGNPELAARALSYADERLVQLADPRLTGVRRALSDELRALEVMDKPDIAGITLTLASLAGVIDSLPLREDMAGAEATDADAVDPELSGFARFRASLSHALDTMVEVEDAGDAELPFVAPDARYFLRANLALKLEIARLALLRGEDEVFRQSLDDADQWLARYYAPDSAAVASARNTLLEVRERVLRAAPPDISQSLRLLRQLRAARVANPPPRPQSTPPAPETEVDAEAEAARPETAENGPAQ